MLPRPALLAQQPLRLIQLRQWRAHIQIEARPALTITAGKQASHYGLKLVEVTPIHVQSPMAAVALTPSAPLSRGTGRGNGLGRSLLMGLPQVLMDIQSIQTGASPSPRKRKRLQALACSNLFDQTLKN